MSQKCIKATTAARDVSRIRSRRRGFSLIDLLVVIGIIGVLIALLLPAVQSAREAARRTQCKNNLHQLGLALQNYHDTNSVFPYSSTCSFPSANRFTTVKHAWTELVLPYLDQGNLYNQVNFSISVDDGGNRALFEGKILAAFACPSNPYSSRFKTLDDQYYNDWGILDQSPGLGPTQGLAYPLCAGTILPDFQPPDCTAGTKSYCVSENPSSPDQRSWWRAQSTSSPGMFNRGVTRTRMADVVDGTSNTIAAGERNAEECTLGGVYTWNAPVFFTGQQLNSPTRTANSIDYWKNCGSSSHHVGGGHFLFADGGVRFVSSAIDFRTYCYLGDKADGHVASPDG